MIDHLAQCRSCPSTREAVIERTPHPATVAIVIDHPTANEALKHEAFQGDSGIMAKMLLETCGVDIDSAYVTSALNCRPNAAKEAMLKNSMLGCRERLILELKQVNPERILCLGPIGYSALIGAERNLPITRHRGRWVQAHGWNILATFNPTMVMGVPDFFRDFDFDVTKFATTDPRPEPSVECWVVESLDEMREAMKELADASFLSLDIETTGFSSYSDTILAIGFGAVFNNEDGISVIMDEALLEKTAVWKEIAKQLNGPQKTVVHPLQFDLKFVRRELLKRGLTYAPVNVEDTMLLHYCTDERPMGRFQSHSLKNMARTRCDAPDYDIQMGKWLKQWATSDELERRVMRKKMHEYLAFDCYYTARMYPGLVDDIMEEDPDLMNVYHNLLIPGSLALLEIEMYGARIDRPFFEQQWEDLQERAAPILEYIQDITDIPTFNPNSPKQVAELVYTQMKMPFGLREQQLYAKSISSRKSGHTMSSQDRKGVKHTARRGVQQEGPTAKVVLKALYKNFPELDSYEVIPAILEYRNLIKNAGTYIKGILNRVDDDDRIRCSFLVHGTSTGRLASSNPNLQNIPEASHTGIQIRRGYVASPGMILVNADYSQLELRIAAHISGDEAFTAVFVEERDVHQEVAFALFRKPKEEITPYERYMAKCANFGVIYGRGAESLAKGPEMDYVEDELGGRRWSVEEVKSFFDAFFANFPEYEAWTHEVQDFAYREQYVKSPLGRRRRFPFIPRNDAGAVARQAVNTPIQGTASDLTFSALARIHKRFKDLNEGEGMVVAHVIITVHDSIMAECFPAYLDTVREIMREEMEDHCPLESSVPFKYDLEAAPNWGDLKGFDLEGYLATLPDEPVET